MSVRIDLILEHLQSMRTEMGKVLELMRATRIEMAAINRLLADHLARTANEGVPHELLKGHC